MDSTSTTPEGFTPPLAILTPTDHTAWIYIASILGLCCFMLFGAVRVLVRTMFTGSFGNDDYFFYAATAVAVIQTGIILGACSRGLGKSVDLLSSAAQADVQRMYYTSNFFFITAVGLTKMSVIAFLHRTSQMRSHRLVFNAAIGVVGAYVVGSIFALALQCDLARPWIVVGAQCPGAFLRWQVICGLDLATEIAIIGLVVYLVYGLQSPWTSKAMVVYIFSFRLVLLIFIAFRIHTFDATGYTTDPFLSNAPFIAWTQGELSASLITATVPTFRNFLKSLNTGFGGIGATSSDGYGSGYGRSRIHGGKTAGSSYQLSKLRSVNRSVPVDEPSEENEPGYLPQQVQRPFGVDPLTGRSGGSAATAHWSAGTSGSDAGANNETASIGSDESRRMIIRKELNWSVKTEPRDERL
ncbi:uncharacterized protein HMPREF1541_02762 [Cyphellophora europaea CBS 101466]|uniref:Rhodopsin domain-containing protein n=1 Tax=Cyphellophora europaea (strain CBS 101466) TaxID=1220924 RepID=W2S6E4_CYPE1|nr:uncharacterized protein HMPREF1541_02762 [Cyphellophora europaea CBS 101466]ETN43603.1 hypothetical protein HMPREF1541_02762 [Cyphellophora europaea CBS 101466]